MERTKQTARLVTGGKSPRKQLAKSKVHCLQRQSKVAVFRKRIHKSQGKVAAFRKRIRSRSHEGKVAHFYKRQLRVFKRAAACNLDAVRGMAHRDSAVRVQQLKKLGVTISPTVAQAFEQLTVAYLHGIFLVGEERGVDDHWSSLDLVLALAQRDKHWLNTELMAEMQQAAYPTAQMKRQLDGIKELEAQFGDDDMARLADKAYAHFHPDAQ